MGDGESGEVGIVDEGRAGDEREEAVQEFAVVGGGGGGDPDGVYGQPFLDLRPEGEHGFRPKDLDRNRQAEPMWSPTL